MHNSLSLLISLSIQYILTYVYIETALHVVKNHTVCIMWCTRSPLTFFPFFTIYTRRRNMQTRTYTRKIKMYKKRQQNLILEWWWWWLWSVWKDGERWNGTKRIHIGSPILLCDLVHKFLCFIVKSKQKESYFVKERRISSHYSHLMSLSQLKKIHIRRWKGLR